MSDYEKVIEHIRNRCNEIKGEWNGDEPGKQEDAAMAADELLEKLEEVDQLMKELDIQMEDCIFCGTEIEDGYCYECDETCQEMGLDYNELKQIF